MRISTIILLLSILSTCMWCAESGPASLVPSDAQSIIDKATADQATIENEANAKRTKVLTAMVEKLKASQEKATKAGKLEASLAIKAEIEKATASLASIAEGKPKVDVSDPVLNALGTWAITGTNYSISLAANKIATWKSADQTLLGTWSLDKKTGALRVAWRNNSFESVTVTGKDSADVWEESANGTRLKLKSGVRSAN